MVKPDAEPLPKIAHPEKPLIHVLHVDDEPEYLKTTKTILEMQGTFKVETASSVEEAMKKMETKTFDAIISDYIIQGIDGLEFLRELRANGNTTPFIIFTGKGREINAIKALNLGADQYINKIGNPETVYSELSHGICKVVKGRRAEEERKVAKKALQKSEEKYRKMIEWASDSIMTFDLNGLITSCNNVSITMAGQPKEELIGKHFSELRILTEEQIQKLMKSFPFMSEEEKPEPFEIGRTDENGSSFFGEVHINLMKEGKKVTGFQTITRDITQRKQMEKQLK
jgi:PAS domain S-box-containing protein